MRLKQKLITLLSANPTKWSNTLKQFVGKLLTNCLSVFDHFVGLALKGLKFSFHFAFCFFRSIPMLYFIDTRSFALSLFSDIIKPSSVCGTTLTNELWQKAKIYLKTNPKFTFTKFILNSVLERLFTCKLF